jgi:transcription elongation GreA/GreB family factor
MESNRVHVSIGCHVEICLLDRDGKREKLSFTIVPDESADFANGFLGESTPLAKIIMDEKPGTVIPY